MDFCQLPTLFKDVGKFKCKIMRMTHTHRYPALWFEVLIKKGLHKQLSVPTMRVVSKYPVTPVPVPGTGCREVRPTTVSSLTNPHLGPLCPVSMDRSDPTPYAFFIPLRARTNRHRYRSVLCCVIHYLVLKFVRFINLNKDQLSRSIREFEYMIANNVHEPPI